MWKLKCYTKAGRKSDVQAHYDRASVGVQAAFDSAVSFLLKLPREDWQRPKAARLYKNMPYKDYYEIRFKADKVQQRPIGYFGPGAGEFTILIWAIEKGNALDPKTWPKKADNRRELLEEGNSNANDFDY